MWERQIILILCILYATASDPLIESRRHSSNRRRSTTTTPRPLLQQYWHSFVRNLPTLPPIGNIFNAGAQHIIETPVAIQYTTERPSKRKTKTKTSKRKSFKKNKDRKISQSRNYYNTFDNSYSNSYQQTQIQLQSLGLDYNGVMHFYEPSSGQYYALNPESQPYYDNNQYGNPYSGQHINQHSQHYSYSGDNGYDIENDGGEHESYYSGYNSEDDYVSDHEYDPENGYDSEHEYDPEHIEYDSWPNNEDNTEYDDGVELVDNWGYKDAEISADRKLKGTTYNFDTIAEGIVKIQKHLLEPESEEEFKLLLFKGQKLNDKRAKTSTNRDTEKQEIESVRNA